MKAQFNSKRFRALRTALGLSQQEMAQSLGIKQGSPSDIERGKTIGSSKRLSVLPRIIHNANIDYLYHNSDQMSLREAEVENSARKEALSQFSTGEILGYPIDHEAELKKHTLFKTYINMLVWDEMTRAIQQAHLNMMRSNKGDD